MARFQVGQAFAMLLLHVPGFGVSSSSLQVPGHPISMCVSGVDTTYMYLNERNDIEKCSWLFEIN